MIVFVSTVGPDNRFQCMLFLYVTVVRFYAGSSRPQIKSDDIRKNYTIVYESILKLPSYTRRNEINDDQWYLSMNSNYYEEQTQGKLFNLVIFMWLILPLCYSMYDAINW